MEGRMYSTTMKCSCGADAELINVLTGPVEGGTYVAHIYHCQECGVDILDDDVILDEENSDQLEGTV